MKLSLFLALLLFSYFPLFSQVEIDLASYSQPKSDSTRVLIQYEKAEVFASGKKNVYVQMKIRNDYSRKKWFFISHNTGDSSSSNKLNMYRSCGNGCVTSYKFAFYKGNDVFLLPPHSNITIDSFILESYEGQGNVSYFIGAGWVIGNSDSSIANRYTGSDPLSDNNAKVVFHTKDKKYEKPTPFNLDRAKGKLETITFWENAKWDGDVRKVTIEGFPVK